MFSLSPTFTKYMRQYQTSRRAYLRSFIVESLPLSSGRVAFDLDLLDELTEECRVHALNTQQS